MSNQTLTRSETKPQQIAIFEEIERLANAAHIIGPKVGKIAVFDASKLPELAHLLALNKLEPGTFGKVLLDIKTADKLGREQPVIRTGQVKEAVIEWSSRIDLMRGWKKKSMAAFFKMAPSDKRLDGIVRAIADACYKHLKLRVGLHKGSFRVLTESQLSHKQDMRRKNMEGNLRNGEKDNEAFQVRGALAQGSLALEMTLFPLLEDDTDDEPN